MKKRILSLFLAFVLCISLLPATALADTAEGSNIIFVVDFSNYPYPINNARISAEETNSHRVYGGEIGPGEKKTFQLPVGEGEAYEVGIGIELWNEYPVAAWKVNNEEYENDYSDGIGKGADEQKDIYILFDGNTYGFYFGYFGGGYSASDTWTISPILYQSEYTASAAVTAGEEAKGSASTFDLGDNIHRLSATSNPGYTFDHWELEGEELNKPSTFDTDALTENKNYTAHFREWNAATAVVSQPERGTAVAESKGGDEWALTATPNSGYVFESWVKEGEGGIGEDLDNRFFAVTLNSSTTYTAYFVPQEIKRVSIQYIAPMFWPPIDNVGTTSGTTPIQAGTRVKIQTEIEFEYPGYSGPYCHLEAYAGDEAAVKSGTAFFLGEAEQGILSLDDVIAVELWPAGIEKVTVVAWTDDFAKQYDTIDVNTAPAGEGLALSYLSAPREYHTTAGSSIYGPDIFNVAAFVDKQTGQPAIYAAGVGGVFHIGYGGKTDLVRAAGMEDLGYGGDNLNMSSYALAVGGPDVGSLTALVKVLKENQGTADATMSYELRQYDVSQGKWMAVADSQMPLALFTAKSGANAPALVMNGNDVWTDKAHWDGSSWASHDYGFTSLYKANATTAYGTSLDGSVFQYSAAGEAWDKLEWLTGLLISTSADGFLLTQAADKSYTIWKDGTSKKSYPAVDVSVLGDIKTKTDMVKPHNPPEIISVGFGGDGEIYALANGGVRSYILRGTDSGWELMDTVEAFDLKNTVTPDDRPAMINRIVSAAEGVTIFFGSNGAFYLQSVEYTITFNSNGGSAVNPIKGVVWSAVDVPIPTREGYTFSGWYYDDTTFDSPWSETVIPASNLTLYAKWTAKEGGGAPGEVDEYAEDREKALNQLDQSLARMDSKDYSSANWQTVLKEYNNGVYAIGVAKPKPANNDIDIINKAVADTIYAALNAAINRMNAVPVQSVGNITVAVSVDANTLGLGYLVRPTLVTVPKYTRASKVVTDLLSQNGYSWTNTGTVNSAFYLAGIKPVDQTKAKPADFLQGISGFSFNNSDKTDRTLGEFDYNNWSGWMYSVGDGGNSEYPSFPGIGSAEYRMINGEVMRWQFTLYGYGADLNAENSAWGTSSVISSLGNKSELTWEVASLRKSKSDTELEKDSNFTKAIKVLEEPAATQEEIDSAYNALINQSGNTGGTAGGDAAVTTNPAVTVDEKGTASVDLNAKDMKAIIDRAKDEEAISIIIEPEIEGSASKVAVSLPRPSVEEIAKDTKAALVVKTGIADVKIPTASIADLGGRGDNTVTISMENLKDKSGKTTGQVKVEIKSGDTVIKQLSGGISATLPVAEPTSGTVLVLVTDEGAKIIRKSALDGKTITALLDGSCTLVVKDNTKTFSDTKNHWAADSVIFASSHELFQGVTATEFAPGANMSRAMLATVLWRLENEADATAVNSFNDVEPDNWYSDAVLWASQNKIVDGYGSGLFGTNDNITREQLAVMLYRYAKQLGMGVSTTDDLSKFGDGGGVSSWASDAMKWAVGSGLISGKGSGNLDPSGNATRAEVSTIMQRMVKLMVK